MHQQLSVTNKITLSLKIRLFPSALTPHSEPSPASHLSLPCPDSRSPREPPHCRRPGPTQCPPLPPTGPLPRRRLLAQCDRTQQGNPAVRRGKVRPKGAKWRPRTHPASSWETDLCLHGSSPTLPSSCPASGSGVCVQLP